VVNVGFENLAVKRLIPFLLCFLAFAVRADNTINMVNVGTSAANFYIQRQIIAGAWSDPGFEAYDSHYLNPGDTYAFGGQGNWGTYGGAAITAVYYQATYEDSSSVWHVVGTYSEVNGTGTGTMDVSTTVVPTYTNYTFCADNTDPSRSMQTTWTYNGSVVQQEVILPGQSACWTTPNIEVTPTPQSFTETTVSTFPTLINPSTDGNTNGTIMFNSPPPTTSSNTGTGGSGAGNGSGGSGGGQTNTVTASTPPEIAPTNIVTFPTPVGAASESTLASGFQLLHGDLLNVITGQKIQNDSINSGFFSVTDELGNILTYVRSNSDQMPTLITAITNLAHLGSTNTFNVSSNVWVQNWPTNHQSNTNLNQEVTQQGISNLLARLFATNTDDHLDNYRAASNLMSSLIPATATNADAATSAAITGLATPLGFMQDAIDEIGGGPDLGSDPGHSSAWEMEFCGYNLDFDPVDQFPTVASFSFGVWEFIIVTAYLLFVGRLWLKVCQFYLTVQTGGVPNMDVFGGGEFAGFGAMFGGNFIGMIVAVIIPAVFLLIWIAVVTVVAVPLSTFISIIVGFGTLFTSVASTTSGGMAVHVLFNFIPILLAVNLTIAAIIIQFTLAKAAIIASAASRWLFGK
jgi:hypothetical protein